MTTGGISRRALFGRLCNGAAQLRPPWSRSEEAFADNCVQCGDCLDVCPTGVIGKGRAGYPIVDFALGQCTFCGKCRAVCESDCFERSQHQMPWRIRAVIGRSCVELAGVACRVCQDACELDAIRFRPLVGGGSRPSVASDRCSGCGACVGACPVRAISIDIPQSETQEMPA